MTRKPKRRSKAITPAQKSARRKNIAVARASKKKGSKSLTPKQKKAMLAGDMAKRRRRNKENRSSDHYYSKRKKARKKSDMIKMAMSGNNLAMKGLSKKMQMRIRFKRASKPRTSPDSRWSKVDKLRKENRKYGHM